MKSDPLLSLGTGVTRSEERPFFEPLDGNGGSEKPEKEWLDAGESKRETDSINDSVADLPLLTTSSLPAPAPPC